MAILKQTDLMIVGRGSESFSIPFSDVQNSVLGGLVLPDPSGADKQAGTLDDRYVSIKGDTLEGSLILAADPTLDLEAATKGYVDAAVSNIDILPDMGNANQQAGTLDDRYVNIFGDTMVGELLLQSTTDSTNAQAVVRKAYVDAGDAANAAAISTVESNLAAEVTRAQAAEAELSANLTAEIDRATDAEAALGQRIDNQKLGDLADVSVGGVTDRQVLSYDADSGEYVARTIALSSNLDYQGQCDITAAVIPGEAGQLLVNIGVGSTDSSWGQAVRGPVPNAVGGELVAYNGSSWQYVGTVGGGLTFTSFSTDNLEASADSKGQLSYNSDTGVFSFEQVDLDSRIPTDLTRLTTLPA